ncbi:MAG: zinc-ribbon domain-containing protein [Lactobacillus kefiranofaciens]
MQIFCPNCGHPLKQGATFCNNCGYNLVTKQMPKSQPQATRQQVATPQVTQKVRKPMKPLTKVLLSLLGVLVVAFIAFYAWGTQHYSKNNQIEWITSSLRDPNKGMAQYITADTPSMKVTDDTVRPLQNYYKDHQTAVTKMAQKLKEDIDPNDQISLVKNGHYLLIFPKYQLQVKTFQPQVETNHGNSEVSMNGKNIGKLSSDDGKYAKKLQLVFPGKYHFTVKSIPI